ncbi:MAG: glycosyltransferase family 9 protein [Rubrivivax sp.]
MLVRLRNWVGDVILGLPALQLLALHGHRLQLVGPGWAGDLLAGHGWAVHRHPARPAERVALWRRLRHEALAADPGFDRRLNTLVLTHSFSSAWETRRAGLRAIGYAADGRSLLLRRAERLQRRDHALQIYWDLACSLLGRPLPLPRRIGLRTPEPCRRQADALLDRHGIRPGFIVICPFTGGLYEKQSKAWPAFPAFARRLRELGRDMLVCPGPGEEAQAQADYAGATRLDGVGLGVYGALLRRAALVVANDTGPAHLAAAVDAPVLSVLGPTPPEFWGPWGAGVQVLRRWPQWPSVDEVLLAAEHRLAGLAGPEASGSGAPLLAAPPRQAAPAAAAAVSLLR